MSNLNNIAPIYDLLKKVIFGSRLDQKASYFLSEIEPGSKILIVGGGSGEIIGNIPSRCTIDYVELSTYMTNKAKSQEYNGNINFIQGDFRVFQNQTTYDWILLPYFLDLFPETSFDLILEKVAKMLRPDGTLIVADFKPSDRISSRQRKLIWWMILFFRLTTDLKIRQFVDIPNGIRKHGFLLKETAPDHKSLVFCHLYKKDR